MHYHVMRGKLCCTFEYQQSAGFKNFITDKVLLLLMLSNFEIVSIDLILWDIDVLALIKLQLFLSLLLA